MVTPWPIQKVVGPKAVVIGVLGRELTVTTTGALATLVQPLLIAWTVKLAEAERLRGFVVFPSLHR
jgi:hypothetical protein